MENQAAPSVLELMRRWTEQRRAFERNKIPIERKVLAGVMSTSGLSYRQVAKLLGGISYVAVRDAQLAIKRAFPAPVRKYRGRIALDESVVYLRGARLLLWLATDLENSEVLVFHSSRTASAQESEQFLSRVLKYCTNRPTAVVGRGRNYPKFLRNIDVKFQIEAWPGTREEGGKPP